MIPVQVVGLGMSPEDLTPRARALIDQAQVLVGGTRLLEHFPAHPGRKIALGKNPEAALLEIRDLAETKHVVVLASGDPNFYGIGPLAVKVWGEANVVIHPNITTVQAAAARLKIAWQDAVVVSLHGRGWEALESALAGGTRQLMIFTDPVHTPAAIADYLLERGLASARMCVLEDLGQPGECLTWLSPPEARTHRFSTLNLVVVVLQDTAAPALVSPPTLQLGLPEEALEHDRGLITKAEVRAVVLAKLALQPGQVLWDIGAGCGSVALEASLLLKGGKIFAIEQNPERARQIEANRDRFRVSRLEVVVGQAPACLVGLPTPQRVFIGGGGRQIGEIIAALLPCLDQGGRVVITATLLETLEQARQVLAQSHWQVDLVHLQVSRAAPLAHGDYLKALNPVWIITAWPMNGF